MVAASGSAQCLGGCSSPVVPSLSPSFSICYEPEGLSQLCSFLLCEIHLAEIWGGGGVNAETRGWGVPTKGSWVETVVPF